LKIIFIQLIIVLFIHNSYSQKIAEFQFDNIGPVIPWKPPVKEINQDCFQFVVVSDRTGGMNRGIFEDAIEKINLLQPDFVVSVGDLIDGYTQNDELMEVQWDEFDSIVGRLEMPFFYLTGNHDISNPLMAQKWTDRLGPAYYHFIYKKVLFLCLNTEDSTGAHISDTQVNYFRDVLSRNTDISWIIVLMHRPLWDYGNMSGYDKIKKLLAGRPYTLFSGHHHNYLYDEKNGNKHIVLATTGGGSEMRGMEFGEFNHIVWVTITDDGPRIANLDLDGIRDEKVVVREDYAMIQQLRRGTWMKAVPAVSESSKLTKLTTEIIFSNKADQPLHVFGKILPQQGIRFLPDSINNVIVENSSESIDLVLECADSPVDMKKLSPIKVELNAESESAKGTKLVLAGKSDLLLDWKHSFAEPTKKINIDGKLDEWDELSFYDVKYPQFVKEDWDWHGEKDGWFRFAVSSDDVNLYLALEAIDQKFLFKKDKLIKDQDKFIINFGTEKSNKLKEIVVSASAENSNSLISAKNMNKQNLKCSSRIDKNSMTVELAIPLDELNLHNDARSRFRFNIAYMDHDNKNNTKPSVLWWRPDWNSNKDYEASGYFYQQ